MNTIQTQNSCFCSPKRGSQRLVYSFPKNVIIGFIISGNAATMQSITQNVGYLHFHYAFLEELGKNRVRDGG
ncbi:hypothetical protein BJX76DRAFT_335915 [Aspergillus varians]